MRTLALLTLVLLPALSGLASAHDHPGCGDATAHVFWTHVWASGECVGATVAVDFAECLLPTHVDAVAAHILVAAGYGCETGVLVDCRTDLYEIRLCDRLTLP